MNSISNVMRLGLALMLALSATFLIGPETSAKDTTRAAEMATATVVIGVGGIKTIGINNAYPTADPLLSSSRYRGGIHGDTIVFHIAQFGRGNPAWFYSYDRGVTWDSAVTQLDNIYSLWYMDYHSSGWYNGASGFHTSWRYRTSQNRPLYRHVSAPYTAASLNEPVRQLGLSTDICYYPVVCANDSEQFYLNLTSNISAPLIVYRSTDNFVTYSRSEPRHIPITGANSTQNGMRANIQMERDGRPVISVLDVGTHAFYRLKWNGSTWDSTKITDNISGLAERGYAYTEMNGRDHLVYMRDSDNRWFHWWEAGGTTWAVDTPSVAVNWDGLGAQQFCVVDSGANARLYMFYMVRNGSDSSICLKTWTESGGWDTDSTIVVRSAHCTWPQCPPYVPANYDSVAVIWKSNATNRVYEINVAAVPAGRTTSDTIPPGQVTDLRSDTSTVSSAALSWTAPGDDGYSGTATQYDIRFATTPISESNWGAAMLAGGEPSPMPAGTRQTFTVTGLVGGTTYYFALKTADEAGNWSSLSNVASRTTLVPPDTIPPAPVADLGATPGQIGGSIDCSWTSPGDDQNSGTATRYDLRYSRSTITSSNWSSAVSVAGLPSPLPAGSSQSFTVTGLVPNAAYYFAIRTVDESGNWSGLSNITSAVAPSSADTIPPASITDLTAATGSQNGTIALTWTATGDNGTSGTAGSYIVKYSPDSITDANWSAAIAYSPVPDPQPAGSPESLTLAGLASGQLYFVAIKVVDSSGNQSGLSNVPRASAGQAASMVVSAPVAVGYTTSDHALLSLPGYRGGRQGDTLILVSAQFGSDQTGWVVSYDRGNSWRDVRARWMTMSDGTPTWYSHSHSDASFAGGLHIGFRGYAGGDPSGYHYLASPYTSETDLETVKFPDAGKNGYYPVVVANGSNDVWFFDISEGSTRDNLRYWHSTDRFATPVTPKRVCYIPSDPQNNWRMGVIMGEDGYPRVSIFDFRAGFCIWRYNPTTQKFDSMQVTGDYIGGLGRSYAQAEMNGLDHIVYTDGATGSLIHFYETSAGRFDSTIVSKSNVDVYAPQLCVYGDSSAARLFIAYVNHDTSVCVKSWTRSGGWDPDSIVVSGSGHVALDPALMPRIPSSWGFVPIFYHNLHNDSLYFVKLYLSAPSATAYASSVTSSSIRLSSPGLDVGDTAALKNDAGTQAAAGDGNLPTEFSLSPNYPNPFNPTTTIEYALPEESHVLIVVRNILGQAVSTLIDRDQSAGRYQVVWDGRSDDGVPVASGVYFCSMEARNFSRSTKMVLLR